MGQIEEVGLDFTSLAELDDGRINKLVLKHLQRLAHDCIDRPADKTKRVVQINLNVIPVLDTDLTCSEVSVEIECASKLPMYRSKSYKMRVNNNGLRYNRDFPDSIDQQPLFDKDTD